MGVVKELAKNPLDAPVLVKAKLWEKRTRRQATTEEWAFCYELLNNVSRSFAMVIQQLTAEVRDAVCVFYLVLRALDTVEDDMSIDQGEKLQELRSFHQHCRDKSYSRTDIGKGENTRLLSNYPLVVSAFLQLDEKYQRVIEDICKRMGDGMAEFMEKRGVETYDELDKYCHYVAGLVGIGLSNLFAATGKESEEFHDMEGLSNHMGLFLQKTNIIRDYKEDMEEEPEPRVWWPKEAWSKHADRLGEFLEEEKRPQAVQCLNELIGNALHHAPRCLEYMGRLRDDSVFRFCAIPQVMAIATLAQCFDNPSVFSHPVKISRGDAARIMLSCQSIDEVRGHFAHYASIISSAASRSLTPGADAIREAAANVERSCGDQPSSSSTGKRSQQSHALLLAPIAAGYLAYAFNAWNVREWMGMPSSSPNTEFMRQVLAILLTMMVLSSAASTSASSSRKAGKKAE